MLHLLDSVLFWYNVRSGEFLPVSYASRALTDVERRYSQIERESLAILFGIQRFRMYLYGLRFVVNSDHKPLVNLSSPSKNPPPRIERWVTRLMAYDFKVVYQPGAQNSADYLSRSNPLKMGTNSNNLLEDRIRHITAQALPNSLNVKQIAKASVRDSELKVTLQYVQSFWPSSYRKSPYYNIRHNLCQFQGMVLFNDKVVISKSLRDTVLSLAHEGHQGHVRTKQRLRAKVWWSGMYADAEKYVQQCHSCQIVNDNEQKPTPIKITPIPKAAWLLVGCDLCGPFPDGSNLLVCVDYFSRYPEVEILRKINSSSSDESYTAPFPNNEPIESIDDAQASGTNSEASTTPAFGDDVQSDTNSEASTIPAFGDDVQNDTDSEATISSNGDDVQNDTDSETTISANGDDFQNDEEEGEDNVASISQVGEINYDQSVDVNDDMLGDDESDGNDDNDKCVVKKKRRVRIPARIRDDV